MYLNFDKFFLICPYGIIFILNGIEKKQILSLIFETVTFRKNILSSAFPVNPQLPNVIFIN